MTNGKLIEFIERGLISFDLEDFKKYACLSDKVVSELFKKKNYIKRKKIFELINKDDFIFDNYAFIVGKMVMLSVNFDFEKLLFYAKNKRLQSSAFYKSIIEKLIDNNLEDEFIANLISRKEFYNHPCFDVILKVYSYTNNATINNFNCEFLKKCEYFEILMNNSDLASKLELFEVVFARFLKCIPNENIMELSNFEDLVSKFSRIENYKNANMIMDISSINIGYLYLDEVIDVQDNRHLVILNRALRDIDFIDGLSSNEVFIRRIINSIKTEEYDVYIIIETLTSGTYDDYQTLAYKVYSLLEAGFTDRERFMCEFKKVINDLGSKTYYSLLNKRFNVDKDNEKKELYDLLLRLNPDEEIYTEMFECELKLLRRP